MQGVGYDQPSFSHFTSMSFWHTAAPNSGNEYGWIGRTASALDPAGRAPEHDREHLRQPDAGGEGREARAAGVHRPGEVPARRVRAGEGGARRAGRAARRRSATRTSTCWRSPGARRRRRRWCVPRGASTRARTTPTCACSTWTRWRRSSKRTSRRRLYYVPLRNSLFDTHVNQAAPHDRQLEYCSDAIAGFFQEMKRIGRADDVVMYVHSEFGRRVPENTSLGTDHGTAQVNFVIGNAVKGGLYGTPPSLTEPGARRQPRKHHRLPSGLRHADRGLAGRRRREGARPEVQDDGHVPGVTPPSLARHWRASARQAPRDARLEDDDGHSHGLVSGTGGLEGRPVADRRRRLERRPRRAPAGPRGLRRHAGRDPEAGRRRPRARGRARSCTTRASRIRRCSRSSNRGSGIHAERLSRKPARSDRSGGQARRLDGRREQAGRQPSGAAGLRSLLLLAAGDDARNAPAGLLVGEPDAADDASAWSRRWRCSGTATSPPTRTRSATTAR